MLAFFLAFLGPSATAGASSTNSSAVRLLDGLCVAAPSPILLLVVILCSPLTLVAPPSVGLLVVLEVVLVVPLVVILLVAPVVTLEVTLVMALQLAVKFQLAFFEPLGISFAVEEQSTELAVMLLWPILQLAVMLLRPILQLTIFYIAFFEQAVQFHDLLGFFL